MENESPLESMVKTRQGFWKGRKIFVTGAAGFIGSWLVKDLLSRGAVVAGLIDDLSGSSELVLSGDIKKIDVVRGQLQDFTLLKRILKLREIDTVFHLGAQTIVTDAYRDPWNTFEANVRGTYNLLEACRLLSVVKRVVVASSDKAYGDQKKLPYRENTPLQGRFPYDVSKSCTDLIAQSYFYAYQLPVVVVRCGNVYGGGDLNMSRLFPGTIDSLLKGESPVIRSDGRFIRDYIFVKDVCSAYLTSAEQLVSGKLAGESFNFSNGKPLSVLTVVREIQKAMGCEDLSPKILNTAKAEIRDQYLDWSKAKKVLGWHPCYSIKQGLNETVEWYRALWS